MNKKYLFFLILGFIFCLLYLSPYYSSIFLSIEDLSRKITYFLAKGPLVSQEKIVIVAIDDYSFKKINQKWPFSRSLYAKAIKNLNQAEAKVIVFDLVFSGQSIEPQDDQALASAIASSKAKVVLASFIDSQGNIQSPNQEFADNAIVGFVNVAADADDVIRKIRVFSEGSLKGELPLFLKSAAAFNDQTLRQIASQVLIGNTPVKVDAKGFLAINYLLKPKDFAIVSFSDLLDEKYPKDIFKEKLILLAPTLEVAHDIFNTPLKRMPGTFILANSISNVLDKKVLQRLHPFISFVIFLIIILCLSLILANFTFLRGLIFSFGIVCVVLWLDVLFKLNSIYFSVGRLAFLSFSFILLSNLFLYAKFLIYSERIKNSMLRDPLSNLYNLKYFYQRAKLASRSIPRRDKFLVIIINDGLTLSLRDSGFEKLKSVLSQVSLYLFSVSKLWAKASDEIIVGTLARAKDSLKISSGLKQLFFEQGLKIKLKLGFIGLKSDLRVREVIPFLSQKIKESDLEIIEFSARDLESLPISTGDADSSFSSLYLDADEKNQQLLSSIEKLKSEEEKTRSVYFQLVASLVSALESKDPYTTGHSQRVCQYALILVDKMGLDVNEKEKVRKAALLHDLGKIGIPDGILHKKGSLTDDEYAVIKEHEVFSAKILEPLEEFRNIIPYILHHHERIDGTGYPHGLAADMIPLGARIIAIADVFDALVTGRDYKKSFPIPDAVNEISRVKGTQLDSRLVDLFTQALKDQHIYIQ